MIRIHLTADDIAKVRISGTADIGAELLGAGYQLANGVRVSRLSQWRQDLARGWTPDTARLFDLYSPSMLPGDLKPMMLADPAATAEAIAATDPEAMAGSLRILARSRALTPFAQALADGHGPSYAALGKAMGHLQAVGVNSYWRQIASQVAAAGARAGSRAAASGIGATLGTLHPQVSWTGRVLSLAAATETDLELEGRALVLRPSVLAVKPSICSIFTNRLELYFPASETALVRDPPSRAPSPALTALLGASRASVLAAIIASPAVTTGQLAVTLGLSAAAASRHAAVLRDAGLVTTHRNGMTVHHHPTRLATELVAP